MVKQTKNRAHTLAPGPSEASADQGHRFVSECRADERQASVPAHLRHLFGDDVDRYRAFRAWQALLDRCPPWPGETFTPRAVAAYDRHDVVTLGLDHHDHTACRTRAVS